MGSPSVIKSARMTAARPMILPVVVLVCLALGACGDAKYPDYDDLDLAPHFADLRSSFQQAPSSRVLVRQLDGTSVLAVPGGPVSRRPPDVQVRPLPAAPNAPTPLVPRGA
jgi:hypothetical protein